MIFKLDHGRPTVVNIESIRSCEQFAAGLFAWDKLVFACTDGAIRTISIYHGDACKWFCDEIRKMIANRITPPTDGSRVNNLENGDSKKPTPIENKNEVIVDSMSLEGVHGPLDSVDPGQMYREEMNRLTNEANKECSHSNVELKSEIVTTEGKNIFHIYVLRCKSEMKYVVHPFGMCSFERLRLALTRGMVN